jgi:hypothetical protein
MRRPRIIALAIVLALLAAAPVHAQSTARPLPAISLKSPAWTMSAGFNTAKLNPAHAGLMEASATTEPTAQGGSWKPTTTRGTEDFSSLELFAQARSAANFMDTAGSLEAQRAGFDALIGRRTEGKSAWALHLANESSFYSFGQSSTLVPTDARPFNDLYQTSVGVQLAAGGGSQWTWLSGLEITMAGEDLVDPTDSLLVGGLGGVRYAISNDVDFSFGLAGESRLEDDAWVMPFFGMDWRIADGTHFQVQGSEMRLEQRLTERLALNLGAVYDIRQYRLNETNPVPAGVFRDEEIRVTAGIDWQLGESGHLGLEVGQVMWNELTVLDSSGGLVGQSEAEKTPFIGFSLRFGL